MSTETHEQKMMLNDVVCKQETDGQPTQKITNDYLIKEDNKNFVSSYNNVVGYQAREEEVKQQNDCKVQCLGTRIPEVTLNAFRAFVCKKYGKLHGVFAIEVTAALEAWMISKQQQTTNYATSTSIPGVRADVQSKLYQIAKKFSANGSFPDFSAESIKNIVQSVIGEVDKRTFQKYMKMIQSQIKEKNKVFGLGSFFDVTRFYESVTGEVSPKPENLSELSLNE